MDIIYTLKVSSNKRKHIYIDDVFQRTEPYYYNEIISNNEVDSNNK